MYRNFGLRLTQIVSNNLTSQKSYLRCSTLTSYNKLSAQNTQTLKFAIKSVNLTSFKRFSIQATTKLNQHTTKEPLKQDTQPEQPQEQKPNDTNEQPKTGFSKYFQREHAWKITLGVFGVTFAFGIGYAFIEWGQPQKDSSGNEVIK